MCPSLSLLPCCWMRTPFSFSTIKRTNIFLFWSWHRSSPIILRLWSGTQSGSSIWRFIRSMMLNSMKMSFLMFLIAWTLSILHACSEIKFVMVLRSHINARIISHRKFRLCSNQLQWVRSPPNHLHLDLIQRNQRLCKIWTRANPALRIRTTTYSWTLSQLWLTIRTDQLPHKQIQSNQLVVCHSRQSNSTNYWISLKISKTSWNTSKKYLRSKTQQHDDCFATRFCTISTSQLL